MKKIYLMLLTVLFAAISHAQNVNVNPGAGSYPTLKGAFDAINAGTHTGAITVTIVANTTEAASAVLNASGVGAASYTSILITPSGGAARTVSGAIAGHLIDLNGADNVTIDGLNTGGNSLTIENTTSGASSTTIRLIADATNNIIQKCTIKGAGTSATLGTVFFSTGTTTGNDGNNINNCDITSSGANFATNAIYSSGTSAAIDNSGNTLNANNISDYFIATGSASIGIFLGATGNSTWTITNNKLFQTATRVYTSSQAGLCGISIQSGAGYTITGNIIGYANTGGTGTTNIVGNSVPLTGTFPSSYTTTGTANATRYIAISCAFTAAGAVSSIQNNTIAGFALYTSSGATTTNGIFCGINVTSGNADIGTVTGNTIGSTSGNGSIYTACTTTAGTIVGIYATSANTLNIQNNTFGAIEAMGTTATLSGGITGINTAGTGTVTISNNTIGNTTNPSQRMGNLTTGANLSNIGTTFSTASGTGTYTGILNSSSGAVTISNNTIRNASANTSATGSSFRGINISSGAYTITNNTINNITSANANTTVATALLAGVGILGQGGTVGSVITQNTINGLSLTNTTTTGTNVAGIALSNTAVDVTRNKIYDLSNASTSVTLTTPGTASGIFIRSGTAAGNTNIINNMISLGNGQTTNTSFIGIWANHGSSPNPNDNLYFNSIHIEGIAASGANPSFGFHRGNFATTPVNQVVVDIRNNIFNNTRTGGTGAHYAIGNFFNATTVSGVGWSANASNYNVLNSADPTTIGHWQTAQTFAGWQTASASDANSISGAAINYVNTATGDLHITTPYPSVVDAAGIDIPSVTVDYDGQTRATLTPVDIGADAGVFSNSPAINFTPLGNICTIGSRNLTATITDPDGVPTAGIGLPVLYWKINAGAYTPATSIYLGSNQYQFTFGGGAVIGDQISYYIAAQDNLGNVGTSPLAGASGFTSNPPAAATPPTNPLTYLITPTLSGTYTVGVGGNFTTLTAAVNAYNIYCIGGPIIFSLTDATYPSETFPITINQNAAASAINTLTIKPAAATNNTITGSVASGAMIRIFGNYVTIDGSNNGTNSRNLTINNTSTTTPSVLLFGSTGTTPIINSGVKNSIIINGSQTATAVVLSDGAALGSAGYFNNITVQNNSIQQAYIGVYSITVVAAGNGSGTLITQNDLNTAGTNSIRLVGLYVQGLDGATLSNNNIGNMANTLDASNLTGIWFATGTVNSNISGNTINGISGTATAPRGIAISSAVAASGINISNNTITGMTSSTTQVTSGIYIFSTTGGVTVQKNKIRDIKNTSTTSTASYGINLATTQTGANVSVNNNFVSDVASYGSATSTSNGNGIVVSAGSGYSIQYNTVHMNTEQTFVTGIPAAINITSGVTLAGAIDLRDNIFTSSQAIGANRYAIYSGAANTVFSNIDYNDYYTTGPNLGFIGSNRATLADIQAGFGGNANSTNILPVFNSLIDLHLNAGNNPTLNNTGTPIGGITTDIDGDTRVAPTDVGADEFTPCSPSATATASSNSPVCEGSTLNLTGTTNGDSFSWTGPNGFTSTLQNPSIPNVTAAAAGVYYFQAFLAGCPSIASPTTVVINQSPTISSVTATPSSVCLNGSSQLNVNASSTLGYQVNTVPFVPIASGTGTITLASAGTAVTALTSGSLDDGYWNGLALPFPFTYYGTSYSTFNVQTNGIMSLSAFTTTTGYSSSPQMPNAAVPNNILGVFGDMEWRFGGVISCYTSGSAPNRIFVINYDGTTGGGFYNSGSAPTALVTYQIQLFENGNKIQFHTTSITTDASHNHTMGIENSGGTAATVVPGRDNSLWSLSNDGTEIALTPLTYSWSPSTFLNNSTIANPLASNVTATTVYNVTVSQGNGCSRVGTVTLTLLPQPAAFTVTGGGSYCIGGSGVLVGLSGSESGVDYQLQLNSVNTGSPVPGTGSTISFGLQTGAGTYTVVATNTTTTCTANMTGSVIISIDPLPTQFTVTGGGSYCSGSSGVAVGLNGSQSGVNYQLYVNASPTGSPVAGTGAAISFGLQTSAGTYTVVATNATTTCTENMTGSVVISIDPLPVQYMVTGGGSYCSGGSGVLVGLSGSDAGVNYQLYLNASPTGAPVAGTGAAISFGLQTAAGTYTVVGTISATGCSDNMTGSVIVTINPLPTLSGVITQPTTCVSADGAIDLTVSGTPGPYTYFWTTSGGSGIVQGVEDQSGLTVGQYTVLVTDGNGCQQTAVFNLTGPGGCSICPTIGSVTTNPTPAVCEGSTVTLNASGLAFMGVTYGITFKYSLVALPDPYIGGTILGTVPNGSLGGGGTTATLNTSIPVSGNYIIYAILDPTPIDPFCRPSASVSLTVNPIPDATATPSSQTICSGNAITTIALSGAVGGTTYNWTRDNTGTVTGIAASGSGDISGTLTNTTAAPITVTFTITPTANGCVGTPITATVLVNPTPNAVATPSSQTICSGNAITTIVLTGAVGGTTYNWTRDNTGTVTGIAASGAGDISGSLTNTTAAPVTVTFTITPTANGCPGAPITATVLVNPTPNAVATPSSQTLCSGVPITTIVLSGSVGGTTFNWTRDNLVAATGIPASGSGNISGTLTNTTTAQVTVTFTITPTANGCTGTPITATVVLNPTPSVNPVPNQTVCNGAPTAPVTFSGPVAGTIYNWINNNTTIGLGASGTGNIPSFNAINTGNVPVTATVTVTPVSTAGGGACTPSAPQTFTNNTPVAIVDNTVVSSTITVSGAPTYLSKLRMVTNITHTFAGDLDITITSPSGTVVTLTTDNGGGNDNVFAGTLWDDNANPGGQVPYTNNNGLATDHLYANLTLASPLAPEEPLGAFVGENPNGVWTIRVSDDAGGDVGFLNSWSLEVRGLPSAPTLVSTSGSNNTPVNIVDNTVVLSTINIAGAGTSLNDVNLTTFITHTFASDLDITLTSPAGTVVTLTTDNGGGNDNVYNGTVWDDNANPGGQVPYTNNNGLVTDHLYANLTLASPLAPEEPLAAFRGENPNGTWTLRISDDAGGDVGILNSWTLNLKTETCNAATLCTGPSTTFTYTVNPTPNAVATPTTQTICSGTAMTPIVLSGNVAGTVFNWTRNNTVNVTGIPNAGSGNISGTPINITGVQQTVTYTITPVANGCTGPSITATLIVNVGPTITCPANITVNSTPGQCGAIVTYPPATATGSPAPVITYSQASGTFFPVGTTTVTATATNVCGVATCTFTITVLDVQAPTITCPANIVAPTDLGACVATVATPNPVIGDNCAVTQLTWVMTGATTGSSPATGINFVGTRPFNLNGTTGQGITTITYTARDASGNSTSCSFTVTVNDAWIPVISGQPTNQTVCAGSNATFSVTASVPAGNPLTYQWQTWNGSAWVNIAGATNSTLLLSAVTFSMNTNSYRVILTGRCSVVTSVFATLFVNALPTVSILASIPPILLPTQSVTLTAIVNPGGGTYQWFKNGVAIPGATSASLAGLTVNDVGTYKVVYTDLNGCVGTSADMVVSALQSSHFYVYPNPNDGLFHIRFYNQANEQVTVHLYDMKGSLVYSRKSITTTPYTDITVDISYLPAGTYTVELRNASGKQVGAKKIIVQDR